jgi:putative FmdB family regulatory protein
MPVYEYICKNCKKRFEVHFTYSEYGKRKIVCSHCASDQVQRKLNRIRLKRSDASRMADMPDPSSMGGIENDPRSFGRVIRRMSQDSGEELGPEFDEVVDRLEAGQTPNEIEQSLPDLNDEGGMYNGDSTD